MAANLLILLTDLSLGVDMFYYSVTQHKARGVNLSNFTVAISACRLW